MGVDEMKIVRVRKSDFEKVMDILPPEELYNGLDYLPDYFDMLLDMQNVEAYAVAIDNKFVSFLLCHVVDDEKTVVVRAGRTRKEYLQRNLIPMLFEHFLDKSSLSSQVICLTGVSGTYAKRQFRQIKNGFLKKVSIQDFRYYGCLHGQVVRNNLQDKISKDSIAILIQESDLINVFCDSDLTQQLFPEGRLVVDWVPYRLTQSNVQMLITPRTSIVGSKLKNVKLALLTFVNYFRSKRVLICNLDVYGHISPTLIDHLYVHFNNVPISNFDNIVIRCLVREGTPWTLVTGLMTKLSFKEQDIWEHSLLCFEVDKTGLYRSSKL